MPFNIIRDDITNMSVDCIVNPSNIYLEMGGGVCGQIFKKAGIEALTEACRKLSPIKTSDAVITNGFNLKAKYIIHTAGPVFNYKKENKCEEELKSCYLNCLNLAIKNKIKSIAFPLISSGIYGYPKDKAFQIASSTIIDFLYKHDIYVYLIVFDNASFAISKTLLSDIDSYIDENYVKEHIETRTIQKRLLNNPTSSINLMASPYNEKGQSLDDFLTGIDKSFQGVLFEYIDRTGKKDSEIYKKANMNRQHFSKIRSNENYIPKKGTIISLAIALELNIVETNRLLESAGYALSNSNKFDIVCKYFIFNHIYDIYKLNECLLNYNLPTLLD